MEDDAGYSQHLRYGRLNFMIHFEYDHTTALFAQPFKRLSSEQKLQTFGVSYIILDIILSPLCLSFLVMHLDYRISAHGGT